MNNRLQFDNDQSNKTYYRSPESKGLIGVIIKAGLAKTSTGAQAILYILTAVIVGIGLTYVLQNTGENESYSNDDVIINGPDLYAEP